MPETLLAFPNITPDMNVDGQGGMTLRDYFAAKALPAMLEYTYVSDAANTIPDENIAKRAYAVADAMLKAREA